MALPETTTNASSTTGAEKPTAEVNKHEKREKPPTKVVIRRLPPGMTQEEFLSQVSPTPDYDYIYSIKGDMTLGEHAFSRVYINFVKSDDIYLFKEKFDNYVFVDSKGHEYAAVVEFASFQKIPKKRGKPRPDPKIGMIESDPIYQEFVESLKQQPNQEEKPEFSYQPSSETKNESSTPLLDFIKQRKIDKLKSKEEKREERRRKEIERKKFRDEERRKRFEEKSPAKNITVKPNVQAKSDSKADDKATDKGDSKAIKDDDADREKNSDKNVEKQTNTQKVKDTKKYDDYKGNPKFKPKYPVRSEKYESYDKRDYKTRREDYRERDRKSRFDEQKKDEYKKESDVKQFPKKVKKYSERREERKYEIRKAEQKKDDTTTDDSNKNDKSDDHLSLSKFDELTADKEGSDESKGREELRKTTSREGDDNRSDDQDKSKNKENDPRVQRRIRNKDRPTMQLYQPGMLSKRRQQEDDKDTKETPIKE